MPRTEDIEMMQKCPAIDIMSAVIAVLKSFAMKFPKIGHGWSIFSDNFKKVLLSAAEITSFIAGVVELCESCLFQRKLVPRSFLF